MIKRLWHKWFKETSPSVRQVWKLTDDGRYYRQRPEAYPGEPHDPIIRHDADCCDINCSGCA